MAEIHKNKPFEITCPKCGHKFSKTLSGLEKEPKFTCPKCGFGMDMSDVPGDFTKGVQDFKAGLNREIEKFNRGQR